MKYFSIIIILGLSLGFFSCKKLTTFEIKNSVDMSIPASGVGGLLKPPAVSVPSSSQSNFQNNGTDASHVKEIKLKSCTLTITTSGQNFDFVDKIHIYISASGVAEQEVAYLDPVPHNASTAIQLTATGILLDDYIKKDTYNIRTETTTNTVGNPQVDIRADMVFSVQATIHK
jgi:hypothetical protein